MFGNLTELCLPCLLFGAVWLDVHTGRVSNRWIALGLCIGYLQCIFSFGWMGCIYFLLRFFFPILLLYLLFLMRALGAGDIKLFSVICCFLGMRAFLQVLCVSFLVGACVSFYVLIKNKNLWVRIGYFREYMIFIASQKKIIPYNYKSDGKRNTIHFSIAIFAGYLLQRISF